MFPSICKAINARQQTDTTGICLFNAENALLLFKKIQNESSSYTGADLLNFDGWIIQRDF